MKTMRILGPIFIIFFLLGFFILLPYSSTQAHLAHSADVLNKKMVKVANHSNQHLKEKGGEVIKKRKKYRKSKHTHPFALDEAAISEHSATKTAKRAKACNSKLTSKLASYNKPASPSNEPSPSPSPGPSPDEMDCDDGEDQVTDIYADQYPDPLRPMNRLIFRFNLALDDFLVRPVSAFYYFFVPSPLRSGASNVLQNLMEPLTFTNNILQGEFRQSMRTFIRFLINSTIGVLGFVDVAEHLNLPHATQDFGATLMRWGFSSGPYLMLPVFGPSSFRDAIGRVCDWFIDPVNYIPARRNRTGYNFGRSALWVVDQRSENLQTIDNARKTSLDFYSSVYTYYRHQRLKSVREPDSYEEDSPSPIGAVK